MESVSPMQDFHPLIAEWFRGRFARPTPPQLGAWPPIRAGRDVLVSAPTGSGKTLAAFLICLDRLVTAGMDGPLEDRINVVYVSPLKALSNDIGKNLETPLAEVESLAADRGLPAPGVRTAVRTGDTLAWERERMVRRPPHILVTTPESLFILLTADRSRAALRRTSTVIVDEIHALVDDKRGSHLALTLARLDDLVIKAGGVRPQRIGLSATVRPIEDVARFLRGSDPQPTPEDRTLEPDVAVVDSGHRRQLDLAVEVPRDELGVVATNEMWSEVYARLAELILAHRTTLVFVNTRRLCERVAHHLAERLGAEAVLAHHGSLSRRLRQTAESQLKAGRLRAVVATASLELGIDIGTVDLVCQIGSPRSIAVTLQRVGRSGHQVETPDDPHVPKGRLFATTRDELIECAALVCAIRQGRLDRLAVPDWPVDVLAQQLVAACACESWRVDDLFDVVRRAAPYAALPRAAFDAVVDMLSDGITTARGRRGAYLHLDRVNGTLRGRRGARLAAITGGGAIPDNANYLVVAEPDQTTVGTVDEDFAVESMSGDIFLLGTTSWRIRRVESGRLRVEDAHGAAPSLPFWRGEAPGRTTELSEEVSRLRERIAETLSSAGEPGHAAADETRALRVLREGCGLDRAGAEQAVAYVRAGVAGLGVLPTDCCVVAERFFDEAGGMQLIVHAPFGARINRAWGLALRKRFCRSFNFELQAAATDNGILISLAEQHSFPLEVIFRFLTEDTVEAVLIQAMLPSPMFGARWRWNASRALAVLRFAGGRKVPPPIQRMRSDDLLASVFPDQVACQENLTGDIRIPDHPLVNETVRDCLHEAMDLDGLRAVLSGIERGEIRTRAIDTAEPSPFCHEILNANPYAFLDDAPLEERRARAVQLRRTLGTDAGEIGALDATAIATVADESWPVVRDADELHDALLTLAAVPPVAEWAVWFGSLVAEHRAGELRVGDTRLWVPTERLGLIQCLYPEGTVEPPLPDIDQPRPDGRETAATELLRGWLESTGPDTAGALATRLAMPRGLVDAGLARLEGEGQVLRGRFTPTGAVEWCNRRVLARIHRLTLGRLRREIEPVSSADFVRFVHRWQHLAPGTLLHGTDGLLQVLRQLQGYEISGASLEREVLARRVSRYDPELLDRLCLSGEVMWGRLSPHPAFESPASMTATPRPSHPANGEAPGATAARPKRVRPTRVAPVTLFLREDADWLLECAGRRDSVRDPLALSHPAREVLDALTTRGASFLAELVRTTGRLASEVEDGLWELVAAGLVSADGFDNLRALVDPKRRRGEGRGRAARPRHTAGRWALLDEIDPSQPGGETVGDVAEQARHDEVAARFASQMLDRWGVVFRDLLARETLAPRWRELLAALRRMEARGEIRGGRFVAGFVGEQFARPDAVELLRVVRKEGPLGQRLAVPAADPLNLTGIVLPGTRVNALSGGSVELLPGSDDVTEPTKGASQDSVQSA